MHRIYRETLAAFKSNMRESVGLPRCSWRWGYIIVLKAGVGMDRDIFAVRPVDAAAMEIKKGTVAHLVMTVVVKAITLIGVASENSKIALTWRRKLLILL